MEHSVYYLQKKRDVLTAAQRIENTEKIKRSEYRSGLWGKSPLEGPYRIGDPLLYLVMNMLNTHRHTEA